MTEENSPKQRFFIALLPPQEIQEYATEIRHYFADRYATKAALKSPPHVTLFPPFEWGEAEKPRLVQQLMDFSLEQAPIPMILEGFAAFPPRVIFINVLKTSELLGVERSLTQYLDANLGLSDSRHKNRPFAPHLTVAFRDLTRQNFHLAWEEFRDRSLRFEFTVSHLTLLLHNGHRWNVDRNFPFEARNTLQ